MARQIFIACKRVWQVEGQVVSVVELAGNSCFECHDMGQGPRSVVMGNRRNSDNCSGGIPNWLYPNKQPALPCITSLVQAASTLAMHDEAMQKESQSGQQTATDDSKEGVLLYYKYVPLPHPHQHAVAQWMQDMCIRLGLRGRVRVAEDGLNVTLGGPMQSLKQHMQEVKDHVLFGEGIDFKLAVSEGPVNARTNIETGFAGLQIKKCKELVTLGPLAAGLADPHKHSAPHLTPQEFHNMLECIAAASATAAAATSSSTAAQPAAATTAAATAAAATRLNDANACEGVEPTGCMTLKGGKSMAEVETGHESGSSEGAVLLDARNLYETRVGHFSLPGVPLLDPHTRCFSELPSWMEANSHAFAKKKVFMYCTGGVRCERASAYLRELGVTEVYQLQGGIQRYLEAFPDGGLFKGKNFVYDDRITVGPIGTTETSSLTTAITAPALQATEVALATTVSEAEHGPLEGQACSALHCDSNGGGGERVDVVGHCLVCGKLWDDYGPRHRCRRCRLLLLVCDTCHPPSYPNLSLLCELCTERQASLPNTTSTHTHSTSLTLGAANQELRTPETNSARHQGPANPSLDHTTTSANSIHRSLILEGDLGAGTGAAIMAGAGNRVEQSQSSRKLQILCLHGFRHTATGFRGRTHAFCHKLRDIADFHFVDAPHTLPHFFKERSPAPLTDEPQPTPTDMPQPAPDDDNSPSTSITAAVTHVPAVAAQRRAWMVSSELMAWQTQPTQEQVGWQVAPDFVHDQQYQHQTLGWPRARDILLDAIRQHGPFDGVLGFSQGAGIAALVTAHLQRQQQPPGILPPFRFVLCASGYPPPGDEAHQVLEQSCPLQVPSLHMFGGEATSQDRQIGASDSLALAALFDASRRVIVRHGAGHIIPGHRAHVDSVRRFLLQF